jgi:hypothetical protein
MAKMRKKTVANGELQGDVTTLEPDFGSPQAAGDTTAAVPDRDRIATRAYELYLARGGGDGEALDDWLSAERELSTDRRSSD